MVLVWGLRMVEIILLYRNVLLVIGRNKLIVYEIFIENEVYLSIRVIFFIFYV